MGYQSGGQHVSRIPHHERTRSTILFGTVSGFVFMTTSLQTGATMGAMSDFATALKAIIIGSLILAAIAVIMAVAASRTGMTFSMFCSYAYGRWGAKVVGFCISVSLIGWTAVDAGLMAGAICSFFPQIPFLPMAIGSCVLFMLTAIFGMKVMSKLGSICIPCVGIFGAISMFLAFRSLSAGSGLFAYIPETQASLGVLIGLAVGSWIGFAGAVLPDVMRYARSTKVAVGMTLVFMLVFNPLMRIIGLVASIATVNGNYPTVLVIQGLAIPGLLIGILGNWGPAQSNLYSCGVTWSTAFGIKSHRRAVLICGSAAILLTALNFSAYFGTFLTVLSNCVPAIVGVFIMDFLYTYRKGYPDGTRPNLDWRGVLAMCSGIAAAMTATYILPQMAIPAIWGICTAMGVRFVLVMAGRRSSSKVRQKDDGKKEEGLVPDVT